MTFSCAVLKSDFNIPSLLHDLPIVEMINADFDVYIISNTQGIGVLIPAVAKKPYYVDFNTNAITYRSKHALQHNELIVRACRIKSLHRPCRVVDATAGFGKDAFILAAQGFELCLIERHRIIAALLTQGIAQIVDSTIQARFMLYHEDAQTYLKKLPSSEKKPDVIYLDPMFAIARQAKVKKDLQILQALLHDIPDDSHLLLPLALAATGNRVVVKRAIDAPFLSDLAPAFTFSGKQVRFDVYITHG